MRPILFRLGRNAKSLILDKTMGVHTKVDPMTNKFADLRRELSLPAR